jgi:hypothetical protein
MTPIPSRDFKNEFGDFVACNPNLRFRDGFGLAPENVDGDSATKFAGPDKALRGPEKKQLFTRVFHAVPNFGRGSCAPNTESILLSGGQDTHLHQLCGSIAEQNFDRYMPFVDDMKQYIDKFSESLGNVNTIGISSRDEMRRQDASHACHVSRP